MSDQSLWIVLFSFHLKILDWVRGQIIHLKHDIKGCVSWVSLEAFVHWKGDRNPSLYTAIAWAGSLHFSAKTPPPPPPPLYLKMCHSVFNLFTFRFLFGQSVNLIVSAYISVKAPQRSIIVHLQCGCYIFNTISMSNCHCKAPQRSTIVHLRSHATYSTPLTFWRLFCF